MAALLALSLPGAATAQSPEKVKVLITFSEKPGRSKERLVEGFGGIVKHRYRAVHAISATVPKKKLNKIESAEGVISVEEDVRVWAAAQSLPWGVDRIDADIVHASNKGAGIKVAVLDMGIDVDHPDLDVAGGRHFYGEGIYDDGDYDDDGGHGTHVAGIVAALDNSIGVVGAAPEAALYAVKVLPGNGFGYVSDLIRGIEWAVANNMDIINMSIWSSGPSTALEAALEVADEAGIVIVGAAGNFSGIVTYPARYDTVIAVSATDSSDSMYTSSGTGAAIELAAPGVAIRSTCLGGTYCDYSGTSMAAPHVAGAAALVMASGLTDLNGNGRINDEVRVRLQQTAEDLGAPGRDASYGFGLVNARLAIDPSGNLPPVASAGPDQSVSDRDGSGAEGVCLDSSASYDADGSIISRQWYKGGTPLGDGVTLVRSFGVGTHNVVLSVTDNEGATDTDNAVITVKSIPTTTVSVPATSAWARDTGVDVSLGQTLYITVSESDTWTGSDAWTGNANGDPSAPGPGGAYILGDANAYSLIGKIGDAGTPFFSGTDYGATVISSGRLYLGMNDDGFGDNGGEVIAIVGLEDAPSSPPDEPAQGGGGCFIATAAYGSYFDGHVETLRDFRDTYLAPDSAGSGFVSLYYRISPPVAAFIDDHPAAKPAVRAALLPSVAVSTVAVSTTLAEKGAIAGLLALVSVMAAVFLTRQRGGKGVS
jgi:subtilisin